MSYCSNCGKQVPDGSKFCFNCGSAIVGGEQQESTSKRKMIYDGEIHKCPNCGETLKAFQHKCKSCGYELRGSEKNNTVEAFADKIAKTKSINKKIELISNFYIPNTKEDIYEFFILAITNINTEDGCVDAWQAKLEQAYHKAKLSFGNTSEFEYISSLYEKALKQKKARQFNRNFGRLWKFVLGAILILIAGFMFIYGTFKGSESGDPDSPYYAMSVIGFFPGMGGVALFIMGLTKKNNKIATSNVIEEEEIEDEEVEEESESIKEKLTKTVNNIFKKK